MERKELEELVKKAFPDKSYNIDVKKNHKDTSDSIQFEIILGFNKRFYVQYCMVDKELSFSIDKVLYPITRGYFSTDKEELINDEEFLIKILRHPECFN